MSRVILEIKLSQFSEYWRRGPSPSLWRLVNAYMVWVLPTGFLKHCIHRTYSDTKNGCNCASDALISKDIFANFAPLRLCEKKSPFKVARFYTGVSRKGAKFAKLLFMGRGSYEWHRINRGGKTRVINLRGRDRVIESVEIWYARARYNSAKPKLRLFGLP
jgi:hypothetical protein